MSREDFVREVEAAIGELKASYRGNASESDLYEATLFVLCVDAAKRAGGRVLLTHDGRNAIQQLSFRRSPGNLWLGEFTYALVNFPSTSKQLEVHLGAYVASGSSKVAHECDVAILDHEEAERSRQGQVHPRARGLIAVIEAKLYATSPSLGVGRGFLGLAQELGPKRCSLVFPSGGSDNILALIAKRDSQAYDRLLPGRDSIGTMREHLVKAISNWKHVR
ncbi:hypothetical protein [Glycomyces buryatensis]|uniref:Uncharacterized protein n=1 Tax=Glycomyces buryatensis TaxID=2570927 RepID=A0A4S8QGD3_9ACTN|nr:hypothetical protein [Glycomyces buryatensis]THV42015.1 hypothetical protein FAB82_08805 [Glycomyces buryatensis]